MRHAFQFKINFTGGIVSPGYLLSVLEPLLRAGVTQVRFGLRQQMLIDATARQQAGVSAALQAAGILHEVNRDEFPNITSSYAAAGIFIRESWLREGVYKAVFDGFDYKPALKINIADSNQTFHPFFTGNINWIASTHAHFWHLVIRFPKTQLRYAFPMLIYTNDLPRVSQAVERVITGSPAAFVRNSQADGARLLDGVRALGDFVSKPVSEPLVLPQFQLPYYEGYNTYGDKSWLGIYRRDEMFDIRFLQDVCRICLQTNAGELYTTAWKSIVIKGIEEQHRPLWGHVLNKYRINVRHASNELNWQVEDGNREGLTLKQQITRLFDKEDIRTFGLCFAIKTQPESGVFGSVLVKRQGSAQARQTAPAEKYDLLYTVDFNPNSREYIVFRSNVAREHVATYLAALCKYYYEQEGKAELLPGSSVAAEVEVISPIVAAPLYECPNCLSRYDERLGQPERNIVAGTAFEVLPADYCCELCDTPAVAFTRQTSSPAGAVEFGR